MNVVIYLEIPVVEEDVLRDASKDMHAVKILRGREGRNRKYVVVDGGWWMGWGWGWGWGEGQEAT